VTEEVGVETSSQVKRFIRKHWKMVAAFATAGILVFIGAIYVFVWFTADAQTTGLVPSTFGLWSMANVVDFILHLILLELLFIGIPAIIGVVIGWQWWKRLPEAEKKEYHMSGKHARSRGASGAVSPLLFIAFALKVFVDGNWNVQISSYTLDYAIGSMVTILIWMVAIFAIPAIIGIVWWVRHETKKTPTT
jgi:hypothetical protein